MPTAYQIPNTNLAKNLTAQDDIKLSDREKIYLLRNVLSLEIMTIFAAKKIKINNLSIIYH